MIPVELTKLSFYSVSFFQCFKRVKWKFLFFQQLKKEKFYPLYKCWSTTHILYVCIVVEEFPVCYFSVSFLNLWVIFHSVFFSLIFCMLPFLICSFFPHCSPSLHCSSLCMPLPYIITHSLLRAWISSQKENRKF